MKKVIFLGRDGSCIHHIEFFFFYRPMVGLDPVCVFFVCSFFF